MCVSSDRAGVLAAIDSNLRRLQSLLVVLGHLLPLTLTRKKPIKSHTDTQLSLSTGCTVPIEAERVPKPAAMPCATKCLDDDENEGLTLLTVMLQKFDISTRARKPNTMLAGMPRACAARGAGISGEGLGI